MTKIDAEFVVGRLNEAGQTLLALPNTGPTPRLAQRNVEFVRQVQEAYGYGRLMPRAAYPEAAAITRMDEALAWLRFVPADRISHKRIVHMRLLVHPITCRHLWSWRRIGEASGWSHEAVRIWHGQAINWIVKGLHADASKIHVDLVDIENAVNRYPRRVVA